MQRERKLAALRRALDEQGWTKGDEAIFHCKNPKGCAGRHHKRKLSVNLRTDKFHCWVCGWGGETLVPILKLRPGSEDLQEYQKSLSDRREKAPERSYQQPRLPDGFRSLSEAHRSPYYGMAIGYLAGRGITSDDIVVYKLGYCEDGEFRYRIIIPSFDEYGELNFVTSRAFVDGIPKSVHCGEYDKDIVFNEYMIDWRKPVTIVEGPFDAIKSGNNSIALLGKQLPDRLLSRMLQTEVRVYVALDGDARREALKLCEELVYYGIDAKFVPVPEDTDPGAMTTEQFVHLREHGSVEISGSTLLKAQLLYGTR